jgi:hypothetical protein
MNGSTGSTPRAILGAVALLLAQWPVAAQVIPVSQRPAPRQIRVSGTIPVFVRASLLSDPQLSLRPPSPADPASDCTLRLRVQANHPWELQVRADWADPALASIALRDPVTGRSWTLRSGQPTLVQPAVPHWAGDQTIALLAAGQAADPSGQFGTVPVRMAVAILASRALSDQ